MKKLVLVAALILLAGCAQETSALPGNGEVVDCSTIDTVNIVNVNNKPPEFISNQRVFEIEEVFARKK